MTTSSHGNIFRVTCQWRGALLFSLICVWISGWVNNGEAGDLRRYRSHYDVIVMYAINTVEARINLGSGNSDYGIEVASNRIKHIIRFSLLHRHLVGRFKSMKESSSHLWNIDTLCSNLLEQSGRSPKVVALFSAANFSSYIIELLQLHDTIHIKLTYARIHYIIAIRSHLMIQKDV